MAPSPLPESTLTAADAGTLVDLADASIVEGLRGRAHLEPPLDELNGALGESVGTFVTITVRGALNGCIGMIEGTEPLGRAVPRLAWSAAFSDPRLPALRSVDYADCTIELSVLSPLSPTGARSRVELLGELRAHRDGLVIEAGGRRGVFLPTVWDQLPDPDRFLDQLWRKAGLRVGSWPRGLLAWRFTVAKYSRTAGASSVWVSEQ